MKVKLIALLLSTIPLFVQAQPAISFQPVVSGLSQPVDVTEAPDSSHQVFIVERTGSIRIWKNGRLLPNAFLDVGSFITTSGQEQGLLSLAFHPDYKTNGLFFIYYTNTAGSIAIARYHRNTDTSADAGSGVVLLTIAKKYSNHNGGHLVFDKDRNLYFGTGDGGSGGDPDSNAQNGQSLLGKMLRIDVSNPNPPYYSIPATNPFASSTTVRGEIIATGLRNPWRWSFDKQTGDMWIADVGQNAWEEVNVVTAANVLDKDYGWSCFEGTHGYKNCAAKPNNVVPIFDYPHNSATGGFSITGGYVYRGAEFPSLQGYYICSDYVSGNGWLIKPNGSNGWNITMRAGWPDISSYGETNDGSLYATSLSGTLYKIVASNALPLHLVSFSGTEVGNQFELKWQVQDETAGDIYVIERRSASTRFAEINRTKAVGSHSDNTYSIKVPRTQEEGFYRLKMIPASGEVRYSQVISSENNSTAQIKGVVMGSNLQLSLAPGTTLVELFDASSKAMAKLKPNPGEKQVVVPLKNAAKGVIWVRAIVNGQEQALRIVY